MSFVFLSAMDRLGRRHRFGPHRRRGANARRNRLGHRHLPDLHKTPGTELFNGNDFQQGFAAGPRLGLIRHGDNGCDFELSYFQIDGWSSERNIGPDAEQLADYAVPRRLSTISGVRRAGNGVAVCHETLQRRVEPRWSPCGRATLLAGFRWIKLRENLQGALEPPTVWWEPPFWNTTTSNNLYGFQIGAEGNSSRAAAFRSTGW